MVTDTEDPDAVRGEDAGPGFVIPALFFVDGAIQLDGRPDLGAIEVKDKSLEYLLSPEFEPETPALPQDLPRSRLRPRGFLSHSPRTLLHLLRDKRPPRYPAPCSLPLPIDGEGAGG